MKSDYPKKGIKELCVLFGKTRAAYYDWLNRTKQSTLLEGLTLEKVYKVRQNLPRAGVRQLHQIFRRDYQLELGRDYLFVLLKQHKLLIRQRKRRIVTTDSRHWQYKHPNLIQNIIVMRPEQVWVSDITYIRLVNGFAYLSLVTDAYSRKIVGYRLHKDLSREGCLAALKMALAKRSTPHKPLIHHSDRGAQYCCQEYVWLLEENGIAISMTNNGDPWRHT
jgi:putative transposase